MEKKGKKVAVRETEVERERKMKTEQGLGCVVLERDTQREQE